MAFSLSQRMNGGGRFQDDPGQGFRGGTADFGVSLNGTAVGDRGGMGDGEGSNTGGPHSSSGFKRALMHAAHGPSRLSGAIASKKDTSGDGFRKPNYFAQGGRRHGLHMGSGAPAISPAMDTGSSDGE